VSDSPQDEYKSRRSVIIASNRGPVTFQKEQNGELTFQRGSGGLVSALTGIIRDIDATWR
jgi:trehalose 6-phosphate synthase